MIFFRPFLGEIIIGKILSVSDKGIKVSLGFFDDIYIPSYLLQSPSKYVPEKSQWVWNYNVGEEDSDFIFAVGYVIRFKVRNINFTKINASSKGIESSVVSEYLGQQNSNNSDHNNSGESVLIRKRSSSLSFDENINTAHMQIIAAVHEDGLGPIEWWQ